MLSGVEESRRSHSLWVTGARVIGAAVTMAIPLVLVRVLDQATFGMYKELFLVGATAVTVLQVGVPASLYYFVPREEDRSQQFLVQSFVLLLLLGAGAAGAMISLEPLLTSFFDAPLGPYVGWLGLYTALALPASLLKVAPNVDRRARLAALVVAASDALRGLVIVGAAAATGTLTGVLVASCAVMGLQVLGVTGYLAWRGRATGWSLDPALLRKQMKYALPFAAAIVVGLARDRLHSYVVAASFGTAQFAVYSVATIRLPFIGKLQQTVGEVSILDNSEHFAEGRPEEMRAVWHRATYALALVLLPIFALAEIYAGDAIRVFFGADYASAAPIFRVYAVKIPILILLSSAMLRATADLKVMLGADALSLGVTVGVLFLLVEPLGPLGAVVSLIVGRAAFALFAARRVLRRLGVPLGRFLRWGRMAAVLAVAATAAGGSAALLAAAPTPVRLFGGSALAVAAYAAGVWHAGLVPSEEREMVRSFSARVWDTLRGALASG